MYSVKNYIRKMYGLIHGDFPTSSQIVDVMGTVSPRTISRIIAKITDFVCIYGHIDSYYPFINKPTQKLNMNVWKKLSDNSYCSAHNITVSYVRSEYEDIITQTSFCNQKYEPKKVYYAHEVVYVRDTEKRFMAFPYKYADEDNRLMIYSVIITGNFDGLNAVGQVLFRNM